VLVHASSFGSQALSGWQTVIGVTGWAKNGLSNDQPRVQGLPPPETAGGSPRRGLGGKETAGQAKRPRSRSDAKHGSGEGPLAPGSICTLHGSRWKGCPTNGHLNSINWNCVIVLHQIKHARLHILAQAHLKVPRL